MAVRKISPDELQNILEKHKLWLEDKLEGEKADLRGANLRGANLKGAYLRGAYLSGAYLGEADLRGADFSEVDFSEVDFSEVDLNGALGLEDIVSTHQTTRSEKEVALETKESEIAQLKEKIGELKDSKEELEENKEKVDGLIKDLTQQEKVLKEEREKLKKQNEIRKKTDEDIDEALTALEEPNCYIEKEIKYQRSLFWIYAGLSILTLIGGIFYEFFTYKSAFTAPGGKSDTLVLIVYIGPVVLMLSLLGTFISLLNKSLKNIQNLKEKEREVKRLGGALKAISKLSQTDSERVERINTILDHMADSLSNSPVIPEFKRESEKEYSSQSVGILNEIVRLKDQVSRLTKNQ